MASSFGTVVVATAGTVDGGAASGAGTGATAHEAGSLLFDGAQVHDT